MICYKDRTFCEYHTECKKGETCSRSLTDKVLEDASEWWGDEDPPICIYTEEPDCFEGIEKDE